MPATGQLSISDVVVAPGDEELVTLRVSNIGTVEESYSIVSTGLVQGWTVIDPPSITVRAGDEQKVAIALRPPKSWTAPAGPSPLTIRVVPHDAEGEVTLVEGTVTVLAYDDRRLSLPHRVEQGRRRAEFDVVLENLGNARASCRLAITDPSKRLTGRFEPPSLGVDPGDSGSVRLIVSARRRNWSRTARAVPFEVHAIQEGHHEAIAGGTLLHDPFVSGRALGRAAAVVAVAAALVGLWFGVVRPQIDEAARSALDEQTAATSTIAPADSVPADGATSGSSGASGAGARLGGFDTRLAVSAPLAGQSVETYTVPAGKVLRVTDVLWQNPNGDEGRLELLRNSTALYGISLRNFTDYGTALVSPFVFGPGEVVSAQLQCERVGTPNGTACAVAITIAGELSDA